MRKIVTEEAVTMPPAPRDRGLGDALLVSLVFPNGRRRHSDRSTCDAAQDARQFQHFSRHLPSGAYVTC